MAKSKFTNIANRIRSAYKHQDTETFRQCIEDFRALINIYQQLVEVRNRPVVDIKQRVLDVEHVDISKSKLTINPVTGRCSLKLSNKSSLAVRQELVSFANQLIGQTLPAVTFRGRFDYNVDNECYVIYLTSESKKFQFKSTYQWGYHGQFTFEQIK